uniref:Polycomb protein SUZ12-2 n=1 Tax=Dugesia japonica TaxID=6161 RepID=A0A481NWA7_DUGJA|nr:polycomb protein SUZ12-2 [Dugesia japonica]
MEYLRNGNCCQQKSDELNYEYEEIIKRLGYITSLYGYLKINFKRSHFLLFRNLSYIQGDRNSVKRKFKNLDKICERLIKVRIPRVRSLCDSSQFSVLKEVNWNLIFVGFFDSSHESQWETIHAYADIYVIHHWKNSRKFQSGKKTTKFLSNLLINCNGRPLEDGKFQKIHEFSQSQLFHDTSHLRIVYSYLLFKLRVLERRTVDYSKIESNLQINQNNGLYAVHYELKFPFYKFRSNDNDLKFYLLPGEYEMRLEVSLDQPTESLADFTNNEMVIENFSDSPERIWVREVSPSSSVAKEYDKWPRILFRLESSNSLTKLDTNSVDIKPYISNGVIDKVSKKARKAKLEVNIVYKFYHNNHMLQWSRSQSVKCPWCNFICEKSNAKLSFSCLVKHLQTFHARFTFKHWVISETNISSMIIEVRLNECYDGSIEIGLRSSMESRSLEKPERKLPFTHIVYCSQMCKINPMVNNPSIDLRPLVWGHNRKYFYSTTGIVKCIGDLDVDSEAEDNLDWLQQMYFKRIEEFTDVNPGEKRIMQLWNSHLLDHKYNGDFMVPILTKSFIIQKGAEIKEHNLRNNLLLHLVNLVEFGVLSQKQLIEVIGILDQM